MRVLRAPIIKTVFDKIWTMQEAKDKLQELALLDLTGIAAIATEIVIRDKRKKATASDIEAAFKIFKARNAKTELIEIASMLKARIDEEASNLGEYNSKTSLRKALEESKEQR